MHQVAAAVAKAEAARAVDEARRERQREEQRRAADAAAAERVERARAEVGGSVLRTMLKTLVH